MRKMKCQLGGENDSLTTRCVGACIDPPLGSDRFWIPLQLDGIHSVDVYHRLVLVVYLGYLRLRQFVKPILLGQVLGTLTVSVLTVSGVLDLILDRIPKHQRSLDANLPQPSSRLVDSDANDDGVQRVVRRRMGIIECIQREIAPSSQQAVHCIPYPLSPC